MRMCVSNLSTDFSLFSNSSMKTYGIPSLDQFCEAVSNYFDIRVEPDALIFDELGLDSFALIELLVVAIELGSARDFPDGFDGRDVRVRDVYHYMFALDL